MLRTIALAVGIAAVGLSLSVQAEVPNAATQAPGYYRFMLGTDEVTVLSDGTAPREVDKIMSKPEEIRQTLGADHQALPINLSINAFLINTGSKLILVDTGAGELFGPAAGHLVPNMRASGYQPEQVDAILLTHIHADHSGGLSIQGKRVFPNATVYVDRHDSDFWLSKKEEAAHPDRKQTFEQSQATVNPYVAAGKLHPFDGAVTLFPGIQSVPAHGHTPGHTAYMIESQGQHLLLWGDTVHLTEVQFADPAVTIEYDVDPNAAIASRRSLMSLAADRGYLVGGAHISFPGVGHVHAQGNGFGWIPLPYADSVVQAGKP
jgi:glyoxylase-like metal-dependent hydrolase (beta-lactamase superfamily II)